MNDSPIRVLLADDQEMVRTGFRFFLDAHPDITVIAEAANGEQAVELAQKLRPDVCLLDIRMPRLNGLEVTRLLAGPEVAEPLRVVMVTTFDLDEYVYGALLAGACGFLLKDAGPTLLVEAVRAAVAGNALISPSVTLRLFKHLAQSQSSASPAAQSTLCPSKRRMPMQPREPLSERELEIVRLVSLGRTNQEIAAELYVSLSTVKAHVSSVQAKLVARNRVEIAAWAWETGHAQRE